MIEGFYPIHPSVTEVDFCQCREEESPFNSVKCFFEVQKEQDKVLIAFFDPFQGFLCHECVV